jgi:hypothetical protein
VRFLVSVESGCKFSHYAVRLKLTFILGFSAKFVNPPIIADTLNSFCIALYCKGMSLMEAFIEVFGGKREFLSKYPVVLMQRDCATEVSRKGRMSGEFTLIVLSNLGG